MNRTKRLPTSPSLDAESTLTDRYQTTVPELVRRALKLSKRDRIQYRLQPDGAVLLTRVADTDRDDPVLGHFLEWLARDIASNPRRLKPVDTTLARRLKLLVKDVAIDLDAKLPADDE